MKNMHFTVCIFCLVTRTLVQGQLKFVDLAYVPFDKGPPNAGFMQAYLTGSSTGLPGETAWYAICATTGHGAKQSLSYAVCARYGYSIGTVYDITQSNAQMPCVEVSCPTEYSNLADCSISADKQWRDKKIFYVVCYQSNGYPLGQHPPESGRSLSVNCDFENGDACGWDAYAMITYSGGSYYQYDGTTGTADGRVLAQWCPTSWSSWSSDNQPTTEAVITSPWLSNCLGYSRFCFTFSALTPLSSSNHPVLNISVLDSNSREMWSTVWRPNQQAQWAVSKIGFAAATPFRLRIRTSCFGDGQPPQIFLDDFLLTTGDCPTIKTVCYNYGVEKESNYGDRYCDCQNGWTTGKWCELTACGGAKRIKCFHGGIIILLLFLHERVM